MTGKEIAKRILHGGLPVPFFVRPVILALYRVCVALAELWRLVLAWVIVVPVMRSIASVGSRLRMERIPYIRGRGRIRIGSDVYISGKIGIMFPWRTGDLPELVVGDRVFIGNGCSFGLARRITIGNDCLIAGGVGIQDNDGHPLDPERRLRREPVDPGKVMPVVIEDNVWIGSGSTILKGVTIGKNSIVGAHSVVTKNVPQNTVVVGNPAEVLKKLQ